MAGTFFSPFRFEIHSLTLALDMKKTYKALHLERDHLTHSRLKPERRPRNKCNVISQYFSICFKSNWDCQGLAENMIGTCCFFTVKEVKLAQVGSYLSMMCLLVYVKNLSSFIFFLFLVLFV